MNATIRGPQSPESYATFWEPLAPVAAPPVPAPEAEAAGDASLESIELTERVPATPPCERT